MVYSIRMFALLLLVAVGVAHAPAMGQGAGTTPIDTENVTICPASAGSSTIPDFTAGDCEQTNRYRIDAQGTMIWARANLTLDSKTGPNGEPLALFVSAKMSSRVYLNGTFVGENGSPSADTGSEVAGLMDAVLYPPQDLFRVGDNEVIILASSHRGLLQLSSPTHFIGAAPSGNRTLDILGYYWPSLVTLGLFVLGLLYFGVQAIIGIQRKTALTFALICGFAGAQLVAEVSRGLVAYTYPTHDLRLILIAFFSACFGLSVTYHVVSVFLRQRVLYVMTGAIMLSAAALLSMRGLDTKAIWSMLLPLCVSLCVAGWFTYLRRPRAFGYFLILASFVALIFAFPRIFLDVVFFYVVALFILLLLIEQGITLAREQVRRRHEEARANRLELALEQVKQRGEASEISLKSAGKMERISTANIVHCRGAGGYCEIVLTDGRELLHTATLAELEEALPATFIRVHRSHLVNTDFIQTLTRDPAGTGTLTLSDGSQVAVSRRIMPSVRQALG